MRSSQAPHRTLRPRACSRTWRWQSFPLTSRRTRRTPAVTQLPCVRSWHLSLREWGSLRRVAHARTAGEGVGVDDMPSAGHDTEEVVIVGGAVRWRGVVVKGRRGPGVGDHDVGSLRYITESMCTDDVPA